MTKIVIREAINGLLNSINEEHVNYSKADAQDEVLEIKKAIRIRIKALKTELLNLYKELEDLEKDRS